jgi:hypothetical protein
MVIAHQLEAGLRTLNKKRVDCFSDRGSTPRCSMVGFQLPYKELVVEVGPSRVGPRGRAVSFAEFSMPATLNKSVNRPKNIGGCQQRLPILGPASLESLR